MYRELEAVSLLAAKRERIRVAGLKLLASDQLKVREAEALVLYLGLEENKWRTHGEVARLMKISSERVRQLLAPSKSALASALYGDCPEGRRNLLASDVRLMRGLRSTSVIKADQQQLRTIRSSKNASRQVQLDDQVA